jgi:hypothetical protein
VSHIRRGYGWLQEHDAVGSHRVGQVPSLEPDVRNAVRRVRMVDDPEAQALTG